MDGVHEKVIYRNSVDQVNRISVSRTLMHGAMSIGERLKQARSRAGYASARSAALAFGWTPSTYASHENGQTGTPPLEAIERYARAFKVTPDWLLLGDKAKASPEPIAVKPAPIRGIVQAGVWREYEEMDFAELDPVPFVPGRWEHLEQVAYRVAGNSATKLRIFDGDYVVCVPYWLARSKPVSDDIVVVERRRGPTIERTVKRLKVVDGGFDLCPESDDPRHEKIHVEKNHGFHDGEGMEIEIVGLVIFRGSAM